MNSNNILNVQVSTTILIAHTKKVWKLIVYIVLFSSVKRELGLILSGQKKKTFNSEHLNFPGKELNVIDITEQ